MTKEELITIASNLAHEYLDNEICDTLVKDLIVSLENQNECIGKAFLHTLTTKNIKPFNNKSKEIIKDLAYNFGI